MNPVSTTHKLVGAFHSKIWGSRRLGPWFTAPGEEPIGEVWFPAGDQLIKFLFTSDKLSIQVHPDDSYAREHENSLGKTEMWHILRADPGAKIALGFKEPIAREQLIPAALSGEIVELLNWIDVQAGDTYFVPPGTVHAIGAGLTLCEIQQNSDVTYRLYDYGRGRELHLEKARDVADLGGHPGKAMPGIAAGGAELLVECAYFRTYRVVVSEPQCFGAGAVVSDARVLVVIEGEGQVDDLPSRPGDVFTSNSQFSVEPERRTDTSPLTLLLVA